MLSFATPCELGCAPDVLSSIVLPSALTSPTVGLPLPFNINRSNVSKLPSLLFPSLPFNNAIYSASFLNPAQN